MKDGRSLAVDGALEQPPVADVAGDLRDPRIVQPVSRDDVDESDPVDPLVPAEVATLQQPGCESLAEETGAAGNEYLTADDDIEDPRFAVRGSRGRAVARSRGRACMWRPVFRPGRVQVCAVSDGPGQEIDRIRRQMGLNQSLRLAIVGDDEGARTGGAVTVIKPFDDDLLLAAVARAISAAHGSSARHVR